MVAGQTGTSAGTELILFPWNPSQFPIEWLSPQVGYVPGKDRGTWAQTCRQLFPCIWPLSIAQYPLKCWKWREKKERCFISTTYTFNSRKMQLFIPGIVAKYLDGHVKAPVFVMSLEDCTESSGANTYPLVQAIITNHVNQVTHRCHLLLNSGKGSTFFFFFLMKAYQTRSTSMTILNSCMPCNWFQLRSFSTHRWLSCSWRKASKLCSPQGWDGTWWNKFFRGGATAVGGSWDVISVVVYPSKKTKKTCGGDLKGMAVWIPITVGCSNPNLCPWARHLPPSDMYVWWC